MQGGAPPCNPASAFYRQKAERKAVLRGSVPLRLPQTAPSEELFKYKLLLTDFCVGARLGVGGDTIESTTVNKLIN